MSEIPTASSDVSSDEENVEIFVLSSEKKNNELFVSLFIENREVQMQLDTGCSLSLAPREFHEMYFPHLELQATKVVLSTYTGEQISPLGKVTVNVEYQGVKYSLPLLIMPEGTCPLFGRNWMFEIPLNWPKLCSDSVQYIKPMDTSPSSVTTSSFTSVDHVIQRYSGLFEDRVGCFTGTPVKLDVHKEPSFHKARPVPYALMPKVEAALEKMEKSDIIERVSTADCAAPIVPVSKKDTNEVRVCGDFSVTYNSCADLVQYPIPKIEDLHTALRGSTVFSVLDMSQAHHQVPIDTDSQRYLTINTHVGLFVFKRLPNGVHSGPAIFQQIMDSVLAGIPRVACYLDDILVAGNSKEDHLQNLATVFERLLSAGFTLNKSKCKFEQNSVTYLGHMIDSEGLHPTKEKLEAVQNAPTPKDVSEVKSFLGLMMFYSRFLPNHSTVLAPLNALLKKDQKWKWGTAQATAFEEAKKMLMKSQTLVHYDDRLSLYLACDASSYGAGCVLSHRIENQDRPIAFASCTLTDAQKNYSQIEREAFSIVFGLRRFHQFLYGRSFVIVTDHRPLLSLFAPDRPVPSHTAAKLQRWALLLSSYKYTLEYRRSAAHANADSMSRLPLPSKWSPKLYNSECYFLDSEDVITIITSEQIKKETRVDPVLSKVSRYISSGFPSAVDPDLIPFKSRAEELCLEQGCVLWGSRVIIPKSLQDSVLKELHETHPGMSRMKAIARSYVWWPNLDKCIEQTVSSCSVCLQTKPDPPKTPVHPWIFPQRAWSRVHIDYAGPVQGKMYLVLVDAYSKYPEVVHMNSTTSTATIKALREIFCRFGLPELLVSDNGPQFKSAEFETFCKNNGIEHRTSAVFHPATNGQAERVVQILKGIIKKAIVSKSNVEDSINCALLRYRNTPHSTTGESPAQLLMGRCLRTRLDLMLPSVKNKVEKTQRNTIENTSNRRDRMFDVGDDVQVRMYNGEKWIKGFIVQVLGSRYYCVETKQGVIKRHVDQIMKIPTTAVEIVPTDLPCHDNVDVDPVCEDEDQNVVEPVSSEAVQDVKTDQMVQSKTPEKVISQTSRYPKRERRSPDYLKDFVK